VNPLGFFHILTGAIDLLGEAFGRKSRKEKFRERFWFAVSYVMLLIGGLVTLVIVIRDLYFR
jgi:hypothetical protein